MPESLVPYFEKPQTLFLAEVMSPPDFHTKSVRLRLRLLGAIEDDKTVPVAGGVQLTLRTVQGAWEEGDRLLARMSIDRFHGFNNPGGFDPAATAADQGLDARAFIPDDRLLVKVTSPKGALFPDMENIAARRIERFRRRSLQWLQESLQPDVAAFYAGLLLGYQHLLSPNWQDRLSRVGVVHLICIAGLHLGFVGLVVFWSTRRFIRIFLPRLLHRTSDLHFAFAAAFLAAAFYALIGGLHLPTWRSLLMLAFYFGAFYLYRPPDMLSALSLAALAILLINPNNLRNISFQLTFAAMLGLFAVTRWVGRFRLPHHLETKGRVANWALGLLRPFEHAFWASIAVSFGVLPLTAYYFHGISVGGFVANTIIVPMVGGVALPLGLLSLALSALSKTLALPFLLAGGWVLERAQELILWFDKFPGTFLWVGSLHPAQLALFYAALGAALLSLEWRRKSAAIALLLLAAWGVSATGDLLAERASGGLLQVTAIDVGQGTSTFVRFPNGTTMLVDGGGGLDDSFDYGRNAVAPFLWETGVKRLDYVVLSHDHPDHRNGLKFIMEHFEVGAYWESGITQNKAKVTELAEIAERRAIPIQRAPEILGDHAIGACRLSIIHPTPSYVNGIWAGKDLNDVSMVLVIEHGGAHAVIPGDIGQKVEKLLFENSPPPGSLLLVAPHHGSAHSSSPLLLDRLQPSDVIISCGYHNLLNFPAPAALERYEERNIPVYRTDLQGAIRAVSDGLKWTVATESERSVITQKDRER
jgi:competence protein ComEC